MNRLQKKAIRSKDVHGRDMFLTPRTPDDPAFRERRDTKTATNEPHPIRPYRRCRTKTKRHGPPPRPRLKRERASEPVGRPSNFPVERKTYSIFVRPCQLTWCSLMPISSIQRRVSNVFRWAVLMPAPASLFHTQLGVGHRQARNLIDL